MKRMKSLFSMSVVTSLIIIMSLGTVYGASVTLQREEGLQKGQENAVEKDDVNRDGNTLTFSPQRLKNKSDSGMESDASTPSVKKERNKPYQEGEGERKMERGPGGQSLKRLRDVHKKLSNMTWNVWKEGQVHV